MRDGLRVLPDAQHFGNAINFDATVNGFLDDWPYA